MTHDEEEALIEEVASAYRAPSDELVFHPAWHDLSAEARVRAFDAASRSRRIEAALDPAGRSTTVSAVLARITRGR